ncbi:hypothetical protein HDA32_005814 [Spinactinospora alkalitolerans]|uniref:Tyrosine specific protein phosphatases domain-containing protein n=1 Tax=Spinactinospora alkalitolerans TaxID=687207 RepID=A0A852U9A5_9ACTN|nr:hypothetical protein [Spinactinospora alkalitolerans]NYE50694.1 hypothetical protein [Spinactinospora alkalitolerans]
MAINGGDRGDAGLELDRAAGVLLGARWGASAVPWEWRRAVHGRSGLDSRGLIDLAARAVAGLRAEGRRVLLHCAVGRSRTPAVAVRYAALTGTDTAAAFRDVLKALKPNRPLLDHELERAVYELAGEHAPPHHDRL